jgi:hypothetical protein
MVRDVLVKVREDQQKLKHAISLVWIRLARAFFEILHDRQCIGEQPFQALRVAGKSPAAAVESLVSPQECFVQEMIQAELLAREGQGNHSCTRRLYANSGYAGAHNTPHTLGADTLSEELGETSTFFPRGKRRASKCTMASSAVEKPDSKGKL